MKSDDYIGVQHNGVQGRSFVEFDSIGSQVIPVLSELNGKPWDDYALGFLHALRPSHIRVTTDGIQLSWMLWRVTVYVDKSMIIKRIEQEVSVGLPDGCISGAALLSTIRHGKESELTKWHNTEGNTVVVGGGSRCKVFKILPDGSTILQPDKRA